MKSMRKMLSVLLVGVAACDMHAAKAADSDQPIHIVVPWAAGGFTDILGRKLAEKLSTITKASVIVDNKPGASGSIGANYVARSKPDGTTFLLSTSDAFVYAINSDANPNPTYDSFKDFTQISLMASQPVLLMVGKNNPAHNVAQLVDYAKKKNGSMTFGSSGEGSAVHLAMELLCNAAGIQMIHVPYKGINPALMDVLGGRIDTILLSYQGAGDHIKTGELRPLAVSSLQRSKLSPDLPTLAETYPGFEVTLWYGLSGPKGMPQAMVDKWNKAVRQALQDPDLVKWLTDANTTPIASTPAQADEFLKKEYVRWTKAIEAARKAPKPPST